MHMTDKRVFFADSVPPEIWDLVITKLLPSVETLCAVNASCRALRRALHANSAGQWRDGKLLHARSLSSLLARGSATPVPGWGGFKLDLFGDPSFCISPPCLPLDHASSELLLGIHDLELSAQPGGAGGAAALLVRCANLQALTLDLSCYRFEERGELLRRALGCPRLRTLRLLGFRGGHASTGACAPNALGGVVASQLTCLILRSCSPVFLSAGYLKLCPNLTRLVVANCAAEHCASTKAQVRDHARLEHLTLSNCGWLPLAPQIRSLLLANMTISDARAGNDGLAELYPGATRVVFRQCTGSIARLPRGLVELEVSECHDLDIHNIATLPKLATIKMDSCQAQLLETVVDDAGDRLCELHLNYMTVDPVQAARGLARCPQLRRLELCDVKDSDDIRGSLAVDRPDIAVLVDPEESS